MKSLIAFAHVFLFTEVASAQFNPNMKSKNEIAIETLFEQCMTDLDSAARIVETCNATTYTAPRWYQQPEAVVFFMSLSLSLGYMAGQRLR
jgi:hypothetical protein